MGVMGFFADEGVFCIDWCCNDNLRIVHFMNSCEYFHQSELLFWASISAATATTTISEVGDNT
jgi:hypothetical protein